LIKEGSRWHCALKTPQRVILKGLGGLNLADLYEGMFFSVDAGLEEILGPYPGLYGTGWGGRYFSVVSRSLGWDGDTTNRFLAVETYAIPTTPLP